MNQTGKQLAIWGVALQLGLVVGLIGTVIGMIRAFDRLAESEAASPADLGQGISISLYSTVAGSAIAMVGLILILVALVGVRYRAPWFRTVLWILSVLWLLVFPIGTIFGIGVIVYLVNHKTEFTEQCSASDSGKPAAAGGPTGASQG